MGRMTFDLRKDLPASFVVFLVALPLSLGIALASGAPISAGIISAVVGGIVVSLFAGAPLQVSGPAAGLTVMTFGYIQQFGFAGTCAIVIAAGGIQLLLGFLRTARYALIISPAVLHAMLAGIGLLIAIAQIHVFFGGSISGSAVENVENIPELIGNIHWPAALAGTTTLVTLILWNRYLAPRFKAIPGALVAVIVGTLVSVVGSLDLVRVTIDSSIFQWNGWPVMPSGSWTDLAIASFALAFVASAESLLCAVATDKLHSGSRADLDRELIGQGAGNLLAGLLGGLPVTGVIVRSSANISAGAVGPASAFFHGIWMLVFASFFGGLLGQIPLAVLAAILIHIGVKLVKIHEIRELHRFDQSLIYAVTLLGVLFINLLWGIGLGLALSLAFLLKRVSEFEFAHRADDGSDQIKVQISGHLSFLSVPKLNSRLSALPKGKVVRLEIILEGLDHAALDTIRSWRQSYEATGGKVEKPCLETLYLGLRENKKSSGD